MMDPDLAPDLEGSRSTRMSKDPRLSNKPGRGWLGGEGVTESHTPPFELAVLAGGCASATVDVCIYPIDTLKTRLQSPQGFRAAGGYSGLFSGVGAAALGAVPGGALFFGVYEFTRSNLHEQFSPVYTWSLDAVAACTAATASCLLRTPAVVVQQRMQVGQYPDLLAAVRGIAAEGGAAAFYSGLPMSIAREIPFAFIQFPVYEGAPLHSAQTRAPLLQEPLLYPSLN